MFFYLPSFFTPLSKTSFGPFLQIRGESVFCAGKKTLGDFRFDAVFLPVHRHLVAMPPPKNRG